MIDRYYSSGVRYDIAGQVTPPNVRPHHAARKSNETNELRIGSYGESYAGFTHVQFFYFITNSRYARVRREVHILVQCIQIDHSGQQAFGVPDFAAFVFVKFRSE